MSPQLDPLVRATLNALDDVETALTELTGEQVYRRATTAKPGAKYTVRSDDELAGACGLHLAKTVDELAEDQENWLTVTPRSGEWG